MLKKTFKSILKCSGRICSYIYPRGLVRIINYIITFIYTGWISRRFLLFGNNSQIVPPLELIGEKNISIGKNVIFHKYCTLTAWDKYGLDVFSPKIHIGDNCSFGEYNHITAINSIKIGDNLLTGRWVTISDNNHGTAEYSILQEAPLQRKLYSKGPVKLGNNIWIGDKVTILSGVTIGDGVVIGANSVVTKDIPPYCVVAGNPAKILKCAKNITID